MVKKTIAVDIDDTITDSISAMHRVANSQGDVDIPIESYRQPGEYWRYYDRVWAAHGVKDRIDAQQIFKEIQTNQNLVPLLPGAEFAILQLMSRYHVVLITSRDEDYREYTEAWLKEQFGEKSPSLYFSSAHKDQGAETKGQICKRLGAEWLIDDNVEHCMGAEKEGVKAILFGEYGWHFQKPPELLNILDWPGVLEYFTDGKNQ